MTDKKNAVAPEAEVKDVALVAAGGAVAVAPAVEMGVLDFTDFGMDVGFEGADQDSFAIPFIQILQKMSPKVDEDHAEYIEGAKAGMFYNTVTGKLYDGKKGILLIPCAYKRTYILWGGREGDGGFKGEFTVEEVEAMVSDPTKIKVVEGKYFVPDDKGEVHEKKSDYYSDTRSHFVIAIDPETGEYGSAILSLASSQIKSSKKLLTALQQKKVATPKGLQTPPTFANLVRAFTVGKSNDAGSWSGIEFTLDSVVTDRGMYEVARDFYKTVLSGESKADYAKADAASAQGDVNTKPTDAEGF
jgi:hypothetical protein